MDIDIVSDDILYQSQIDTIEKQEYNHKLNNIKLNINNTIKKRLKIILSKNYKYNKYIKIYPVTSYVKYAINILKTELFSKNIMSTITIKGFFTESIYVKFYNPVKYTNNIRARFNKNLDKCLKKNSDIAWLKTDIKYEITAQCHTKNYNLILKDSDYDIVYKQYHYDIYLGKGNYKTCYRYGVYVVLPKI
ncbi:DUF5864 domain-containing protein [Megavirus chiliensis]|uniref:Uncharacterized protein n=2 Tax=Megamimivirinae TaxID=3044648 RepID=A0A2L2DMM5_MIMIV|nr:hypothetical protein MegaChil _gp0567 [Megavirus chiliensis]AEQ33263.1 DUF5864 domain-containing protein [Megavirus chiliensis]AVG47406.1 hypothetical protein [Acanthamoeba polyphaga mimivirus]